MNVIIGNRGQGKTALLIRMSAAGEGIIVTPNKKMAECVKQQAKLMKLDIPEPISLNEFLSSTRIRKNNGPYLLDEIGLALESLNIRLATLNSSEVEKAPEWDDHTDKDVERLLSLTNPLLEQETDTRSDWAVNEVALAIETEKQDSEDADDWSYGAACYKSALRAYQCLRRDGHSGYSIQITKSILNRLIDGRCLTPIEDTPDIWNEVFSKDGIQQFQCKRMSGLFKELAKDGTVKYSDIDRVSVVNVDTVDTAYQNDFATRLVDMIFPIRMPYLPSGKKFIVVRDELLPDPKKGDYAVGYLYILTPEGRKVELNRYFREENGQMIKIEKAEFDARKKKRVDKK